MSPEQTDDLLRRTQQTMSSYAHEHEQSQYDDFLNIDNGTEAIPVDSKCRQEKELLTKSWVEQQRIRTSDSMQIVTSTKDTRNAKNYSVNSVLDTKYNGDRDHHSDAPIVYSIHENQSEDSANVNTEILLTERRVKHTEYNVPQTNIQVASEMCGVALRGKLEDINLHREALKLPHLSKSPLVSPYGSPCASPRSSIHGGSDSSAASSPGDSPALSPKGKFANSLPRNFIHFKETYNDEGVQVTRSLPGSPVIRRSLLGRSSDVNDRSLRRQLSGGRETNGRDHNLTNRIIENNNGGLLTPNKKTQTSMRANLRLCPRRPGTPIAHDLRPGSRISQLSKSMSDLGAIAEKSTEISKRRDRHGLFPSITAK